MRTEGLGKKLEDEHGNDTKKCVVAESLTVNDYEACFLDSRAMYIEQMLFVSKKHEVHKEIKWLI